MARIAGASGAPNVSAPSNEGALFALALACAAADEDTRRRALAAVPRVARSATDLLAFAAFADGLRGWGRGLRRGVARWFTEPAADVLAGQAVALPRRDGWTLRDLLRLTHPVSPDADHRALFDWIAHPDDRTAIAKAAEMFPVIEGFHRLRETTSDGEGADLISRFGLPAGAVPAARLTSPQVWAALLAAMSPAKMVRNLAQLDASGVLTAGSEAAAAVVTLLGGNAQAGPAFGELERAHPFDLLAAREALASGGGAPTGAIVDALDQAFLEAMDDAAPSGLRLLVAVDTSASMGRQRAGNSGLTAAEAAAALAMLYGRTEPAVQVVGFDTLVHHPAPFRLQRFDEVVAALAPGSNGAAFANRSRGSGLAAPIEYARQHQLVFDGIVIVTDQSPPGDAHPFQAFGDYRERVNPKAKLAVLALSAVLGEAALRAAPSAVVPADDPAIFGNYIPKSQKARNYLGRLTNRNGRKNVSRNCLSDMPGISNSSSRSAFLGW